MQSDEASQQAAIEGAIAKARAALLVVSSIYDDLTAETIDLPRWLDAKARLGPALQAVWDAERPIAQAMGAESATARMASYFQGHVGDVVTNYELWGVAGTLEWARRVRELQVEAGWDLDRGVDAGLKPGEYRLNAAEVDAERAERWRIRNEVRRLPGSGGERCLEYLRRIFPDVASKDDLAYVSRIGEWPRRMREHEESGWEIFSSVDDPTLPPGSYRLGSLEKGPPRTRQAIKQRAAILERDNHTCQECGASPGDPEGTRLQVHHTHQVRDGGTNESTNLVTLCSACHAGKHAAGSKVEDELLNPAADPDS